MNATKFEPDTPVLVNATYPYPEFHGRQGMTAGYTSDRKPYAVVAFFKEDGAPDEMRFLFDTELEYPEPPATA